MKAEHLKLGLIMALALAGRLWLAPMAGHVYDLQVFKSWVEVSLNHPPLAIYAVSTANYPPLGLLPMLTMGWLYHQVGLTSNKAFTVWLKLPAIIADLLTVVIIFRLVRQRCGPRLALFWAGSYAFNPGVGYVSAWWGQLEALYALPMLLSVAALAESRPGRAWFYFAIAVLVKPHAAILGPLLLTPLWTSPSTLADRWRGFGRGVIAAGLVFGLVLGPLAWVGQLPMLLAQIQASAGRQLFPTLNAHNGWYLLTAGQGSFAERARQPIFDNQPYIGSLTIWDVGLILLALWVFWVMLQSRRKSPPSLFLLAAALSFGYFMLPAESHERYLFPTLALLTVAAAISRPGKILLPILSLTFFLNLIWVAPAMPLPSFSEKITWGLAIATFNLFALAYLFIEIAPKSNSRVQ